MRKLTILALLAALSTSAISFARGQARLPSSRSGESLRSLERISSKEDFDRIARTYYRGRFYALPHAMFVIDRRERGSSQPGGGRVYYVNSNEYAFHKDFVNASYLSLERGRAFYESNYVKSDRRFLLGTIAFHATVGKHTFEFWEGDRLTRDLLAEAQQALASTFYAPLFFKPNAPAQEEAARALAASTGMFLVLTAGELARDLKYQPLNTGAGIGQLRILERMTSDTVIDRNQIVIFKEVPIHLTPLSGIIMAEPASPLSHINMLARSWAIPSAHIKDADRLFKQLEGRYVRLEVGESEYRLAPADLREIEQRQRQWMKRAEAVTPRADLRYDRLTDLKDQRAWDGERFGAKSANLGEIVNARIAGLVVPPGFTIPFHHYQAFVRRNDLEDRIRETVEEDRFVHDPAYRRARLAEVRKWIIAGRHDPQLAKAVGDKVRAKYRGKGLFARSSTNAEDLPEFSGAGLYTTVPNIRTEGQLMEAVKSVWASVWNFEAYEARESFGMNHFGVYPAVLIQEGINADSAGVLITTDPFDHTNRGSVYINAKRGLGIKVVEGRRVPEQILYDARSSRIHVLTRSGEDTMLAFDQRGGVKEVEIEERRAVLTDDMVERLSRAAIQLKKLFGNKDQDVEWLYLGGQLYIVQSRPYVRGS